MAQILVHRGRPWAHRPQQLVPAARHPDGHPPARDGHLGRLRVLVTGHEASITGPTYRQLGLPGRVRARWPYRWPTRPSEAEEAKVTLSVEPSQRMVRGGHDRGRHDGHRDRHDGHNGCDTDCL